MCWGCVLIIRIISTNVRCTFFRYVRRAHTHTQVRTFYVGGGVGGLNSVNCKYVSRLFTLVFEVSKCTGCYSKGKSWLRSA